SWRSAGVSWRGRTTLRSGAWGARTTARMRTGTGGVQKRRTRPMGARPRAVQTLIERVLRGAAARGRAARGVGVADATGDGAARDAARGVLVDRLAGGGLAGHALTRDGLLGRRTLGAGAIHRL